MFLVVIALFAIIGYLASGGGEAHRASARVVISIVALDVGLLVYVVIRSSIVNNKPRK